MFQSMHSTVIINWLLFALQVVAESHTQAPLQPTSHGLPKHRIAIVGAGAGGSSAAYHLTKFQQENPLLQSIEIDIFEANSYIGGRTTTINALDDPRYPTELGASIFVKVNHILYNLTKEFNLSTKEKLYESTGAADDLAIWDGSSFLFSIANDDSGSWGGRWRGYWDIAKLLWRYGLSPIRTQRAKNNVVSNFLRMYDEYFPIASLTQFVSAVGLSEYTGITGQAALEKNGVSEQFSREIVQSSTRVNYAQNLNSIHGVETMVCMAIEGAMSIDGGNWQIFDQAVQRSGAKMHLNTTVTHIIKTAAGTYQVSTSNSSASTYHNDMREYDSVILASPYQFSNITFSPPLPAETIPQKIDYVTLHVTLFTSPYRPAPAYFNLTSQNEVPDSVLTTIPVNLDLDTLRGALAVGPTGFWSLSTLRILNPQTDEIPVTLSEADIQYISKLYPNTSVPNTGRQYLYKIFSPKPLTATDLRSLFDFPTNGSPNLASESISSNAITDLPKSHVPWSYTKVWQSYPYLPPTLNFSALLLDSPFSGYTEQFNQMTHVGKPDSKDAFGVFYTSGVESFISTMETSALMGRNIAKIIVGGLEAGLSNHD